MKPIPESIVAKLLEDSPNNVVDLKDYALGTKKAKRQHKKRPHWVV